MHRHLHFLPLMVMVAWLSGCSGVVGSLQSGPGAQINVKNAFRSIQAGSAPVTLNAVDKSGQPIGVTWLLTYANVLCSPGCGTLAFSGVGIAVYTPPAV